MGTTDFTDGRGWARRVGKGEWLVGSGWWEVRREKGEVRSEKGGKGLLGGSRGVGAIACWVARVRSLAIPGLGRRGATPYGVGAIFDVIPVVSLRATTGYSPVVPTGRLVERGTVRRGGLLGDKRRDATSTFRAVILTAVQSLRLAEVI